MKRYVEIFWCPTHDGSRPWVEIAYQEPKRFYPLIQSQREGAHYLKCPAFSDNFKNTFVIESPFDLNISFDHASGTINTDRYGQHFYDNYISNRIKQTGPNNPVLFSIDINYLFFSHDSVEMEFKDVPLLVSESTKNLKVVLGKYNISKWLRPTDYAVEVIDATKPVTLRAGDPLFAINFITENNVPVKLTRVLSTPELHKKSAAGPTLKMFRPNLNLKECYELAENFMSAFKKSMKK